MIEVPACPTADTRTCDYTAVSKNQLLAASMQHIMDVRRALAFFASRLAETATVHDTDKITDIDGFHADFLTGFRETGWLDRHYQSNRHHLLAKAGIRADVNLIDVLDFIADHVMSGVARSGTVSPLDFPSELLQKAFQNTVTLLKAECVVKECS